MITLYALTVNDVVWKSVLKLIFNRAKTTEEENDEPCISYYACLEFARFLYSVF